MQLDDTIKQDQQQILQTQQQPSNQASCEEPAQVRKLFIGGLDYKTSEETLREHFEKFGEVIDCIVMREPQTRKSRGFGFVTYAKSYMVDKAQEARPHRVDGREVEPKRAIPRGESGKLESQATVKKVFLGGLTDDLTESDLKDHFKEFGNILNISIATQKDTGKKRGFAFVEFDDYDPVDKIVLIKHHLIKGTRLEVKKAIPKTEMDARRCADPRMSVPGPMGIMNFQLLGRNARSLRNGGFIWENGPYPTSNHPINYPTHPSYKYPPQYQSACQYDPNWMIYEQGSWTNVERAANPQSCVGPMRLSYQHRSSGPYGTGFGPTRNRNYNQLN